MLQHKANVEQWFGLPAGFENAPEATRNQYYENRCKGYMKMCSVPIVSLRVPHIRLLVGLMKATNMVEEMDLRW
jgi:hypothetical protein